MFNAVEFIREICNKRKIPISVLEKECGFSNGYLNPKKINKIPYDRCVTISKYLGIPVERLLGIEQTEKAPAEIGEGMSRENLKFALFGKKDISDALLDEVMRFAKFAEENDKGEKTD